MGRSARVGDPSLGLPTCLSQVRKLLGGGLGHKLRGAMEALSRPGQWWQQMPWEAGGRPPSVACGQEPTLLPGLTCSTCPQPGPCSPGWQAGRHPAPGTPCARQRSRDKEASSGDTEPSSPHSLTWIGSGAAAYQRQRGWPSWKGCCRAPADSAEWSQVTQTLS